MIRKAFRGVKIRQSLQTIQPDAILKMYLLRLTLDVKQPNFVYRDWFVGAFVPIVLFSVLNIGAVVIVGFFTRLSVNAICCLLYAKCGVCQLQRVPSKELCVFI